MQKDNINHSSSLNPEKEIELCHRILLLAEVRTPITGKLSKRNVNTCYELNGILNNLDKSLDLPGRRRPDMSKTEAQAMNQRRPMKLNRIILEN
jgi:hypothetical protein